MLNWNCISFINLPWMLTEEQRKAYTAAWETFQQRTILSRLKKSGIVLLLCLLGIWMALPSTQEDTLSLKLAAELNQAELQLEEETEKTQRREDERNAPFGDMGNFSFTVNPIFKMKVKQLEKDLEVAKQPKAPRVPMSGKILTLILAVALWLYLMAQTFDGGFKKDGEEESFHFQYLCSGSTLKENLLEILRRFGELLAKGGQMLRADMASQTGCVIGGIIVLAVLYGLMIALIFIAATLHVLVVLTMCVSTWLLLGWFIWCRPIQIRLREITPAQGNTDNLRGSELYEMPDASSASPVPPAKSIVAGEYLDGNVTLLEEGSYMVGTMTVDQDSEFSGITINGVKISKASGEGKEMKFEVEGKVLRVLFTKGQWWQMA